MTDSPCSCPPGPTDEGDYYCGTQPGPVPDRDLVELLRQRVRKARGVPTGRAYALGDALDDLAYAIKDVDDLTDPVVQAVARALLGEDVTR